MIPCLTLLGVSCCFSICIDCVSHLACSMSMSSSSAPHKTSSSSSSRHHLRCGSGEAHACTGAVCIGNCGGALSIVDARVSCAYAPRHLCSLCDRVQLCGWCYGHRASHPLPRTA